MQGLGKGVRSFKKGLNEVEENLSTPEKTIKATQTAPIRLTTKHKNRKQSNRTESRCKVSQ